MDPQNNQIVIIFLVSTAFVLLLAILVVLFLVIYQKRIIKQESRLQKLESDRKQVLLQATIEGQERERKRLAKELHDGIGSLLSGLSLNLKYQKEREVKGSDQAEFLTEACTLLDAGMTNIRQISHDLMPITLETFGMVAAIKESIQPLEKNGKFKFDLNLNNLDTRLASELELGVLRIFQELLQNTLKHAEASVITVTLQCEQEQLLFKYNDNGKGFKLDRNASNPGIGIRNMESRVEALGGTIDFDNRLNEQMQIIVQLPIKQSNKDL